MSSAITCINLEEMRELLHLIYIYIYKENKFNKSCEHILYIHIRSIHCDRFQRYDQDFSIRRNRWNSNKITKLLRTKKKKKRTRR